MFVDLKQDTPDDQRLKTDLFEPTCDPVCHADNVAYNFSTPEEHRPSPNVADNFNTPQEHHHSADNLNTPEEHHPSPNVADNFNAPEEHHPSPMLPIKSYGTHPRLQRVMTWTLMMIVWKPTVLRKNSAKRQRGHGRYLEGQSYKVRNKFDVLFEDTSDSE